MVKKVFLSGVQPSGRPHIGNYFGAMKQFVELQEEYTGYILIVDYHALHSLRDPKAMRENIIGVLLDFLAIGLNPEKVTIFKQSDISEHTELTWIFDTITTMPYLMRAHAFKDAEAKDKEIDVGTFNYPVLMATDILLYDTDMVPVGADQKQHVEICRDIAEKFNNIYGETFKLNLRKFKKKKQASIKNSKNYLLKIWKNLLLRFARNEKNLKMIFRKH